MHKSKAISTKNLVPVLAGIKFDLDSNGLTHLWSKISMEDYPNNETLMAVINAIDQTKLDKTIFP